jgi:hypothetical protein
VQAIINLLGNNDKKNYNIVRPEGTRRFPVTIASPGISESYYGYGATLDRAYDMQLDQYALPCITSNNQLPKSNNSPKSSEFWFCRELIKVKRRSIEI